MFPAGVITREIKVGPAFDLVTGAPYAIRAMIVPTQTVVWGATGDPVAAKLKTYNVEPGSSALIPLPVTDQNGYENGKGGSIVLEPGQHAFAYKISLFYLINGGVAHKIPESTVIIPTGGSILDIDDLVTFTDGDSGQIISSPDTWDAKIAEAVAAAEAAESSAAAALEAIESVGISVGSYPVFAGETRPTIDKYVWIDTSEDGPFLRIVEQ